LGYHRAADQDLQTQGVNAQALLANALPKLVNR
jgi:hypothetical protein